MPKKTYEEYREAHMSRNRASSPDKTDDQLGREADLAAGNAVDQGWIEDRTGGPTGRELALQVAGGGREREPGWAATTTRNLASDRRAREEARRQDELREERRGPVAEVEIPTEDAVEDIFAKNFAQPMDGKSVTVREVTVTPMADRGFGRSLGNKPEGAPVLTSHTPDSATLSTGQRVREGDDLDGKPGHQVTLISKVAREDDPRIKDTVVEVTKPNGEPYELTYPGKEPSGVDWGPGAGQDWMMWDLPTLNEMFPVLTQGFAGADASQIPEVGSSWSPLREELEDGNPGGPYNHLRADPDMVGAKAVIDHGEYHSEEGFAKEGDRTLVALENMKGSPLLDAEQYTIYPNSMVGIPSGEMIIFEAINNTNGQKTFHVDWPNGDTSQHSEEEWMDMAEEIEEKGNIDQ
jgi:hypothetical protein